jgi:hypothetical protein
MMKEKKVSLFMETTKKEPEETMAEIQRVLRKYGLKKFMADYNGGEIVGCIFSVDIGGDEVGFKLPIRWEPLYALAKQGRTKYIRDKYQAQRVAWRIQLRWIEAQLAIVDIGQAAFQEVFMPYLMVNSHQTVYEKFSKQSFKALKEKND